MKSAVARSRVIDAGCIVECTKRDAAPTWAHAIPRKRPDATPTWAHAFPRKRPDVKSAVARSRSIIGASRIVEYTKRDARDEDVLDAAAT